MWRPADRVKHNRAMPANDSATGAAPRYERWILLAGIATLIAAGWGWLLYQDWSMAHMDIVDMAMPSSGPWTTADIWLVFVMWAIMMVAMMVPSVTPVVLLYHRVVAGRDASAPSSLLTSLFIAGYLIAWTVFSIAATLVQWTLHSAALLSPMMVVTAPVVGGAVLIVAGAYQWTPLKHACLSRCRSPLAFLLNSWRNGKAGAIAMGLQHGVYCTGCCWLLMAILFVVGVMNLAWIAVLTAFVLAEKVVPRGEVFARASGIVLIAWGAWLVVG
jgi:predicted metal-binding membrane protein